MCSKAKNIVQRWLAVNYKSLESQIIKVIFLKKRSVEVVICSLLHGMSQFNFLSTKIV